MDGWITIGTKIDNSGFRQDTKKLKNEMKVADSELSKNIQTKISGAFTKALNLGKGLSNVIGGVVKSTLKFVSSLGSLIAIGGILGLLATGVFTITKALDKANGESEQMKANLSYIGYVGSKLFENLLTPAIDKTTSAIERLVQGLYNVVYYIGYILSAWTGKNLFEGTSVDDYAEAMEKANKSAKGTANSTAKIKKDLMSFDEINKLSDNSSGGGAGGGVSGVTLPNLTEPKIPEWVEWIAKNGDKIADILLAIAGGLVAIKLGLDPLQSLGLGVALVSIKNLIKDIKKYIEEPSWGNFGSILQDIGLALLGISLLIGPTTPIGQFALVVAGIVWVIGDLIKVIEKVKGYIEQPSWQKFSDLWDEITSRMGLTGLALKRLKEPILDFIKTAQEKFSKVKQMVNDYIITPIANMLGPLKNLISLAIGWIVNKFEVGFGAIPKALVSQINALISKINTGLVISVPPYLQAILGTKSWRPSITPIRLAQGGIINNPGRGVALGNGIVGGEKGREMVLPLDDNTLDRLGSAIARHQVINATIVNQMNGRTISRELKQIVNENDFSYNV